MQGITLNLEELLALRHPASQLHLPQPRITKSTTQGSYQSTFRGRGMDFVETRIYQPGDDIRSINWAVTARTGKAHTKIYQEEKDRPIYVVVDFNSTMFFGTRAAFKSVVAAKAAALIAWAALKNGDKVGGLFIKEVFNFVKPCRSKQNLVELLKNIMRYTNVASSVSSDCVHAISKLKSTVKSGSLIYFLSDFYFFDSALQNELQHLSKNHQVTNVLVYDPLEKNPPEAGRYLFHDKLQNNSLLVDTYNKNLCENYRTMFEERYEQIRKFCCKTNMHLASLATNDDLTAIVRRILNRTKK